MEGDDSLDLSSTMPLQIPDPDGNNIPLDEFEENEEIYTDKLRNISVNFSSSLPVKLLRLLLGPVMIFCLIVLMVFSEQVETNNIGIFMIVFPSLVLLPSWYAAEKQFATAENDFGDNNKNTDKLSLNSFPGAERILSMIRGNRLNERIRLVTFSSVGILVLLHNNFEDGSLGNVLILMTSLILLSIGVAQTIRLERSIQMRSTEFKYLPFHAPTQHSSQMHTVLSDLIEAHMDPDSASQWSAWLDELKPSIRNKLPASLARERIVQAVYLSNMTGEDGTNAWKLNNILTSIVRREMRDRIMQQESTSSEFEEEPLSPTEKPLPFNITTLNRLLEHTEAWQPGLFRIIRRVRNDILSGNVSLTDSEWRMDHDLPLTCSDGQGDLFLMIHNFGEVEETVEVEVVVPDGLPISQTFRVTPQPTPSLPAAIPLNTMSMTETLADRLSILMERGLVLWIGIAWSPKSRGQHPVQIHLRKEGGETISSVVLSTDVLQRSSGSGSTQVRMRRASSLGIEALREVSSTLKMR
ncbi:MAG: hypothetical protein VXW30_05140 [Candidatus Thermoplasmatota archaeon]|nr:hypothetical protein [Candidatus Thermoplasmatota archaeon]MEC8384124.1 hypothetical protein [Candidatus Thermoplasmatota archaeon]MEC9174754.1 hypothetical protein [Candidatus Thermoplasmatota archaeon]MED5375921.1 hypothetical protein [Candidatus Thermoplasmatota archaeon]|tara:strand:+ start:120 stop:1694 length:1575 start_codon:yes stop_codon:yes gene_type:complete